MFFSHAPTIPLGRESTLRVLVLSPHRLVPLALAAAGKKSGIFSIVGAASSAEQVLSMTRKLAPDVLVFDPEVMLPSRMDNCLEEWVEELPNSRGLVLILEPAQPQTAYAGRMAWMAGVRSAMTSQDAPEFWPHAINAAANGATYASPLAAELFGLAAWDRFDAALHVSFVQRSPVRARARQSGLLRASA